MQIPDMDVDFLRRAYYNGRRCLPIAGIARAGKGAHMHSPDTGSLVAPRQGERKRQNNPQLSFEMSYHKAKQNVVFGVSL
jgi:hypothetical protein